MPIRPLPVERSQGSVSSLVARFQTAADRDKTSAEREARRQNSTSRRSSSHGATEPPIKNGQTLVKAVGDGDSSERSWRVPDEAGVESGKVGIMDKVAGLAESLKDLTVGGGVGAKEANEDMAAQGEGAPVEEKVTTVQAVAASTTPSMTKTGSRHTAITTSTQAKVTRSPSKSPAAASRARASASTSPKTSTQTTGPPSSSTSPTIAKAARRTSTISPAVAKIPRSGSTILTSPSNNSNSRTRLSSVPTPSKPAGTPASTSSLTTTKTAPAPASATTGTLAAPKPTLSSSASTRKLSPSHTGPARRTPSISTSTTNQPPATIKTQVTGTPSRPTASSLAKARIPSGGSPAEKSTSTSTTSKRQGTSFSRGTGAATSRLSSSSLSPPPGEKPPASGGLPRSGSRLLQGTAASRAKAAEHPPAKPSATSAASVQASMGPTRTNGVTPKVSTLGKSSSPRSGLAGAGAVRRGASEGTGHIAGKTSGMRHTEGSEQSIEQEAVAEVIGAVPAESMSSDQANDEDLDGSEAEATAAKPAGNTDADHAEPEGMRKADAAEPVPAVDNTQTDDERRIEQPALPPMQETIDEPENGNGHLMEESNELIEEIPDEA